MVPESLRAENLAVVLVDLAVGPLHAVTSIPVEELRKNAESLARACELLQVPVVLAEAPFPGEGGRWIPEIESRADKWLRVRHSTNNCWESPEFADAVTKLGRKQLVFAGVATDVGVGLTALAARRKGLEVAVLVDVCGTLTAQAERAAHLRLQQAGVSLLSWTTFAAEVQRDFSKGQGREILKLISQSIAQSF